MKMEDLETKLDKGIISKYLEEVKMNLPAPSRRSLPKVMNRMRKMINTDNKKYVTRLLENERPIVKKIIDADEQIALTPRIADVVCRHIEEKIQC